MQSWSWGEFQKSIGREVRRYETPDALAQIVSHPLPGGMFGWNLYRGPIGIKNQESRIMETIISDLKKTKGIFLHLESNNGLKAISYKLKAKSRQPQHTLIVDIRKHEEALLAEMHEKTRYNIRLAERHGVAIKENAPADDFVKLMKETTARDKFSAHSESYYREMLRILPNTKLFVAYQNNEPLAAAIINFFGNTATYLHGASSNEKRNLMAPYLLHWEIMKNAKFAGYGFYDFWGIAPPLESRIKNQESSHAWAGITRFKKGFSTQGGSASGGGGEIVALPEAIELPLRPISYKIYSLLKRLRPYHRSA